MALHSRIKRINEELRTIIAEIIQNEVKDPRLGDVLITITQVNTSKDLHQAQVFVSILGDDDETKAAMQALHGSQSFVRRAAAAQVTFRYMPELIFKLDEASRKAASINSVLRKIEIENPAAFDEPPPEEGAGEGAAVDPGAAGSLNENAADGPVEEK